MSQPFRAPRVGIARCGVTTRAEVELCVREFPSRLPGQRDQAAKSSYHTMATRFYGRGRTCQDRSRALTGPWRAAVLARRFRRFTETERALSHGVARLKRRFSPAERRTGTGRRRPP